MGNVEVAYLTQGAATIGSTTRQALKLSASMCLLRGVLTSNVGDGLVGLDIEGSTRLVDGLGLSLGIQFGFVSVSGGDSCYTFNSHPARQRHRFGGRHGWSRCLRLRRVSYQHRASLGRQRMHGAAALARSSHGVL